MTNPEHVSVPVEPTEEMENAALTYWRDTNRGKGQPWRETLAGIYKAMIEAAPRPGDEPFPTVDQMVARFLAWVLPNDFSPDAGVEFRARSKNTWPTGTNLLTATQAESMVRYMLEGMEPLDAVPAQEPFTPGKRSTGPGHVQRGGTG